MEHREGLPRKKAEELDVFPSIELKPRDEAADQEWNVYAKKGVQMAAADVESTAEVEDGKHTSGRSNDCRQKQKWHRW